MSRTERDAAGPLTGPLRLDVGFRLSLLLDPDGTVRSVTEVSGLGDVPPDAFLGRSIVDIAARNGSGPVGATRWAERLAQAASASGTVHHADRPPDAPASAPASIDSMLTPIRLRDGTLDAFLFVIEDRTEFVLAQQAMRDSEERFRSLAESLPQMVWSSPASGVVDYFSQRWADFTGRSIGDLIGRGYRDLIHPDDLEMIAKVRAKGDWSRPVTFRLRRHDGEYRTMEAFAQAIHDQAGAPTRLVGATTDITERRNAEDRSRELQEQLRTALQMTGLGRFTVDLRPPALTGDDRVAEIMGTDPAVLLADRDPEHLFDQIHPDDTPRIRNAFAQALAGGQDFSEEYRIYRPTDGGEEARWVSVAGRVEFDDDGPVRMVGVIEDTTSRHQEQEARTRMQKREAIGTLAGGIAHDFNNVIGAILSNAALAETEIDHGASPLTSVQEIRRGATRAADLVRRLLSLSREDEPMQAEVDVADVVREVAALLMPGLPRNVLLDATVTAAAEPATVLGDGTQLHQVLMNLVTNAAQALESTGGTISLRLDRVVIDEATAIGDDPVGECLRLRVRDNGPGMPDSVRQRAFDPFFTTKPAGQGTGLGLAASQSIVRSHRGSIRIESMVDSHTAVTVLLPSQRPDAEGAPAPHQSLPDDAGPHTAPPRVLFVDDEQALATLAERALPVYGCEPVVFTDPCDALDAFKAAPDGFDALVTDLSMPRLTGLELSAALRELRPELPVVLTSGYLTPENEAEARRQGIEAIIAKPCSIDDLASAVLRLVGS